MLFDERKEVISQWIDELCDFKKHLTPIPEIVLDYFKINRQWNTGTQYRLFLINFIFRNTNKDDLVMEKHCYYLNNKEILIFQYANEYVLKVEKEGSVTEKEFTNVVIVHDLLKLAEISIRRTCEAHKMRPDYLFFYEDYDFIAKFKDLIWDNMLRTTFKNI